MGNVSMKLDYVFSFHRKTHTHMQIIFIFVLGFDEGLKGEKRKTNIFSMSMKTVEVRAVVGE